jgi:periplasmic protein TonB
MTNNEILRASLLDIIFENRNKDYGAYALRRGYNHRLLIALGVATSTILLFILINSIKGKDSTIIPATNENGGVLIHPVEIPKAPDKPKEIIKARPVVRSVEYVNRIEITSDDKANTTVPDIADLKGAVISSQNADGPPAEGKSIPVETGPVAVTASMSQPEKYFEPEERDPEFPGGPEALRRFLSYNLQIPGALEAGEKKMVLIRFKVGEDGAVSTLEIVNSGGTDYDREVIRVCKKMPRWRPAVQNGISVPVSYVLPVTFIGAEQ